MAGYVSLAPQSQSRGRAISAMELPNRHATSLAGSQLAPSKCAHKPSPCLPQAASDLRVEGPSESRVATPESARGGQEAGLDMAWLALDGHSVSASGGWAFQVSIPVAPERDRLKRPQAARRAQSSFAQKEFMRRPYHAEPTLVPVALC